MESQLLTCEFCEENDFDEIGLEIHLTNHCMGDQSPKLNSIAYRAAFDQNTEVVVDK